MKPSCNFCLFKEQIVQSFPYLSDTEAKYFRECHEYYAPKEDVHVPVEYSDDLEPLFRQLLERRYWIVRTYFTPDVYGSTNEDLFEDCTVTLPDEPATVAATLALAPKEHVQWEAVEAWSWVYRHALLLHVEIHDFEEWCKSQSPEPSRRFVMSALIRSGHQAKLSQKHAPTISDVAVGNA